jgi:hypothetical protein
MQPESEADMARIFSGGIKAFRFIPIPRTFGKLVSIVLINAYETVCYGINSNPSAGIIFKKIIGSF